LIANLPQTKICTYDQGYITQPVFMCRTCANVKKMKLQNDPRYASEYSERATYFGFCLGCSLNCHADHDVVELGDRARFRCDCGNAKCPLQSEVLAAQTATFQSELGLFSQIVRDSEGSPTSSGSPNTIKNNIAMDSICVLQPYKDLYNAKNVYNHNFKGVFCRCRQPYDPKRGMRGCAVCHDYYHDDCLNLMPLPLSPGVLPPRIAALLKQCVSNPPPECASIPPLTKITDENGVLLAEDTVRKASLSNEAKEAAQEHAVKYFEKLTQALNDPESHVFLCAECAAKCPGMLDYTLAHSGALAENISSCTRRIVARANGLRKRFQARNIDSHEDKCATGPTLCCLIGNDYAYHCQLVATCLTCPDTNLRAMGACSECVAAAESITKDPSKEQNGTAPRQTSRDICVACAFNCHVGHNLVNWRVEPAAICDCSLDGLQSCAFENDSLDLPDVSDEADRCFKPTGEPGYQLVDAAQVLQMEEAKSSRGKIFVPRGPGASTASSIPKDGFDFALCIAWKQRFCRCARCKSEMLEQGFEHAVEDPEVSEVTQKINELEADPVALVTSEDFLRPADASSHMESNQNTADTESSRMPGGSMITSNPLPPPLLGVKRSSVDMGTASPLSSTSIAIDNAVKRVSLSLIESGPHMETEESAFLQHWARALPALIADELKGCLGESTCVTKEIMEEALAKVKARYREIVDAQKEELQARKEDEDDEQEEEEANNDD